jgi:hypothetical protein
MAGAAKNPNNMMAAMMQLMMQGAAPKPRPFKKKVPEQTQKIPN